ncbi:MAG: glycosyltransferase family 9 protein [Verrucomicrobia bacterium]|nr:glycosyltransferase family 9 protein [Verrucomicrobiota bacterium]
MRPDTYGDLILFESACRFILKAWPDVEVAILVRRAYADLAPLFPSRLRWLTTDCEPYRSLPNAKDRTVDALRHVVEAYDPDLVVGACFHATWVEYLAAAFAPTARAVRLGSAPLEIGMAQAVTKTLTRLLPKEGGWSLAELEATYPERVEVEEGWAEVAKSQRLAEFLTGKPAAAPPTLGVPPEALAEAEAMLGRLGLTREAFLAVCPAGTSNVPIKAWPSGHFAEVIAYAETKHQLPSLLLGSPSERKALEETAELARTLGASRCRVHLGTAGTFPHLAALLLTSRAYFGNDTGALHAAAALGRPVLGVYGGGTWPRFRPSGVGPAAVALKPMTCFGCGWECPFGDAPCLSTLPVAIVRTALDSLLAARGGAFQLFEQPAALEAGELRLQAAESRFRKVRAESASRQRRIAELEDVLRRGRPDSVPTWETTQDQISRLRSESARLQAELDLARRLLQTALSDRSL